MLRRPTWLWPQHTGRWNRSCLCPRRIRCIEHASVCILSALACAHMHILAQRHQVHALILNVSPCYMFMLHRPQPPLQAAETQSSLPTAAGHARPRGPLQRSAKLVRPTTAVFALSRAIPAGHVHKPANKAMYVFIACSCRRLSMPAGRVYRPCLPKFSGLSDLLTLLVTADPNERLQCPAVVAGSWASRQPRLEVPAFRSSECC